MGAYFVRRVEQIEEDARKYAKKMRAASVPRPRSIIDDLFTGVWALFDELAVARIVSESRENRIYFSPFFDSTFFAAIRASPNRIPELLSIAPGQSLSDALLRSW